MRRASENSADGLESASEGPPCEESAPRGREGGSVPTVPTLPTLTPEHAAELEDSAVPADVASAHGVYSAMVLDDLPEWARWIGESALPALVYPMAELDGAPTGQVKPKPGTVRGRDGEVLKYVSPSDGGDAPFAPRLPVVRRAGDPTGVLIVEGVKQGLAAAAYTAEGWMILRMCGITSWSRGGVAPSSLKAVKGLPVVIVPDADAARNRSVYDGAVALGDACNMRGAASVRYVRLAAMGNAGLDDVLAGDEPADRAETLSTLISAAKPKPADRAPAPKGRKEQADHAVASELARSRASETRPVIHVGDDRLAVINAVGAALKARFDGTRVFNHGDVLSELVDGPDGVQLHPVGPGELARLVAASALTVQGSGAQHDGGCKHLADWPDGNVMAALAASYREFSPVGGVSHVPLVRADGTIASTNGYDAETRHVVALSHDVEGIVVPDDPTDADIAQARSLLCDELLGDFLFKEESDRARAVAALLTPMIRPHVPTSPYFVINGLQPGVGKGKLVDVIYTIALGRPITPGKLSDSEDEIRKTLTSSLLAGNTLIAFDEVEELSSKSLNMFVTAPRMSDRLLGASRMVSPVNSACLFIIGNNIAVQGDAVRRTVMVRLSTDEPNPEFRSGFRHELPTWAVENRRELLAAALTLVRAWYSRGCPEASRTITLGSFEQWQRVIGGVLEVAGIIGYLDGLAEERAASDFPTLHWTAHLEWLAGLPGIGVGKSFTSADVMRAAGVAGKDAEMPPDISHDATPRVLGQAYALVNGRWWGRLRLVSPGKGQGGRAKWQLEEMSDPAAPASGTARLITSPPPPAPPQSTFVMPEVTALGSAPVITDREEVVA